MKTFVKCPLTAFIAWIMAAPAGAVQPQSVFDTAGVEIIRNPQEQWTDAEKWRISPRPKLQIGTVFGDTLYEFGKIAGATVLAGGVIVVADAQYHRLRFYDSSGKFMTSVGRFGGGPSEFRGITWLAQCRQDTVFVYDYRNYRVSVFGRDGRLARTFPIRTPVSGRSPSSISCWNSAGLLVDARSAAAARRPVGRHRLTSSIALTNFEGKIVSDFGEFPGPDRYRHEVSDGPLPLGKETLHAVNDEYAFIATGDYREIGAFSHGGDLRKIIRWSGEDLTISSADLDRYRRTRLAGISRDAVRAVIARYLRDLDFPDSFPSVSRMEIDSEGNLWIREYHQSGESGSTWLVFDRGGRLLGPVRFPASFSVLEIGSDYLLGVGEDSLKVQYLRVYGLIK